VRVTVLPAPPVVIVLKAPNRISRTARSLRLRIATLAPATIVVGPAGVVIGRQTRVVLIRIKPNGGDAPHRQESLRSSLFPRAATIASAAVIVRLCLV
jgi:hypothetical protein